MENEMTLEEKNETTDDVRAVLANNIADYRRKMNLSRAEFAKRTGLTEAALGYYERGERTPHIGILRRMADVLNVPIDVLANHNAGSYDAVKEYRFDQACNFFSMRGYQVTEKNGFVILSKERPPFRFSYENGIVSKTAVIKNKSDSVRFKSTDDFMFFAEKLMHSFLFADGGIPILKAAISNLLENKNFLKDLYITDSASVGTPF